MFSRTHFHLFAGVGFALCLSLCAQESTTRQATLAGSANPSTEALSPLSLGLPKAPVELFRRLLVMSSEERQAFLATRSPETQKLILAKIREYAALKPEQLELRLRVTELRWYLLPLLSMPATNRTAQLSSIPKPIRSLVEDRLEQWDKLSSTAQKQMLDNESIVSAYLEQSPARLNPQATPVAVVSDAAREQFEAGIRRWQALPETQRQEVVIHFNEFFHLTPAEQNKTLRTLSETERGQIEKTLHTFEEFTPSQRSECLQSFQKFASLSPDERLQFLKNAQRWELMSPSERQSWRTLVLSVSRQPPAPPGLGLPSLPPAPVSKIPPGGSAAWATNAN